MKKVSIVVLLLIFPLIVHAETIIYDVCESGCEYRELYQVHQNIDSLGDLSDKDIIVNINSDYSSKLYLDEENNAIRSLTINGNNHVIDGIDTYAKYVVINELNSTREIELVNNQKIVLKNSNLNTVLIGFLKNNQISTDNKYLNEILEIDDVTLKNVKLIGFVGNIKIENMNFKNIAIAQVGGTLNIYNSQISKTIQIPLDERSGGEINIYNSTFDSLKYKNITSSQEYYNELSNNVNYNYDSSSLNFDIYDINIDEYNIHMNTTVYFDKNIEIKLNESIDLTNYLNYYTSDKEIDYVIENDENAKIEGLTLTGLKEGQTNITITTDEGHVVYRIKLNVIKEIEIPLSGINIKTSAFIIGIVLLGVISVCIYLLIRNKKVKEKK